MDTTENKTGARHLSLCSGYDGIGLGLERAGLDIGFTVHVEIEAFAGYNLVKKIEAGALGAGVHYPDLKSFPFRKFRGCFDILSGGFPCQPFSQAGKGKGDEDPRHLFPYIKQGIEECRPAIVLLENVEGIVSAKLKGDHWNDPAGTPVLLHVIRELERVGYRATAVPSSASEVGAPHQRNRWFIVGIRDEVENPECLRSWSKGGYSLHEGRETSDTRRAGVPPSTGWKISSPEPDNQSAGRDGCEELADDWSGGRENWLPESSKRAERDAGELGNRCPQPWPSRPGQEQFAWEPPRCVGVVGNAEHDGPHGAAERGSVGEAGNHNEEGQEETREPTGAGRPKSGGNLQRLLADGNGWGSSADSKRSGGGRSAGVGGEDESDEDGERRRQTQPSMGGNPHGPARGLDYAELCESCDNRTDELRLLGNGVVPQSACDAFLRGMRELGYPESV